MLINWLMLDAYNNDHTKMFADYIYLNTCNFLPRKCDHMIYRNINEKNLNNTVALVAIILLKCAIQYFETYYKLSFSNR